MGLCPLSWTPRQTSQELLDSQELQEWLAEKNRMNDHIVQVCSRYGHTARLKSSKMRFLSFSRGNLLNCINAQVSCSSWLAEFANLDHLQMTDSNRARLSDHYRLV